MTEIIIPYTPRIQFMPFHNRTERWGAIVSHVRAGKTVAAINELIKSALLCPLENPRYAYIAPYRSQAKDIAWDYLKKYTRIIPGAIPNESELRVDLPNGGRVRLYGADNYDAIEGLYLDGVVLDEYGKMHPGAWSEVIRNRLSDRLGWAMFTGTPKGQNHFFDLWEKAKANPKWFTLMLKASQTRIIPESELADIRADTTAEQYATDYECSFSGAIFGAYYGNDIENLRQAQCISDDFGHEPGVAVNVAWDVGGTTALWFFQLVGHEVRLIDFLEGHNVGAEWYANEMRRKPYVYGKFIMPSDADDPKEIVATSWVDALAKLQFHDIHVLPKQRSINDGINLARLLLKRCRFVKSKTADGVSALQNYCREYDDNRKVFKEHPLHDWASHGADAFRHLALGIDAVGQAATWGKPINYGANRVI